MADSPHVCQTYSEFIVPTLGRNFDTGTTHNLTWYGGRASSDTGLTTIFDLVLTHRNDTDGLEKTIFSRFLPA